MYNIMSHSRAEQKDAEGVATIDHHVVMSYINILWKNIPDKRHKDMGLEMGLDSSKEVCWQEQSE
jgi:hypothetical protein